MNIRYFVLALALVFVGNAVDVPVLDLGNTYYFSTVNMSSFRFIINATHHTTPSFFVLTHTPQPSQPPLPIFASPISFPNASYYVWSNVGEIWNTDYSLKDTIYSVPMNGTDLVYVTIDTSRYPSLQGIYFDVQNIASNSDKMEASLMYGQRKFYYIPDTNPTDVATIYSQICQTPSDLLSSPKLAWGIIRHQKEDSQIQNVIAVPAGDLPVLSKVRSYNVIGNSRSSLVQYRSANTSTLSYPFNDLLYISLSPSRIPPPPPTNGIYKSNVTTTLKLNWDKRFPSWVWTDLQVVQIVNDLMIGLPENDPAQQYISEVEIYTTCSKAAQNLFKGRDEQWIKTMMSYSCFLRQNKNALYLRNATLKANGATAITLSNFYQNCAYNVSSSTFLSVVRDEYAFPVVAVPFTKTTPYYYAGPTTPPGWVISQPVAIAIIAVMAIAILSIIVLLVRLAYYKRKKLGYTNLK